MSDLRTNTGSGRSPAAIGIGGSPRGGSVEPGWHDPQPPGPSGPAGAALDPRIAFGYDPDADGSPHADPKAYPPIPDGRLPADRVAGDEIVRRFPSIIDLAVADRAFLRRS